MSFYTVSTGNTVQAADPNQFANALNGTTNSQMLPTESPGSPCLLATMTSAPSVSDAPGAVVLVTADTSYRVELYVRHADGYGGIGAGAGSSITATLYATNIGWKTDQSLTIASSLDVLGQSFLDNGTIVTNGLGAMTVVAVTTTGAASFNQMRGTFASGAYYDGSAQFSGTGSGTYTHGLNHAPTFVGAIENVTNATTTVGVDSIGSTTCHMNINGSVAFLAWAVLN